MDFYNHYMNKDKTLDKDFREYKRSLRSIKSVTTFNINLIDYLDTIQKWSNDYDTPTKVVGIKDEYYKRLNDTIVYPIKLKRIKHNVYFNSGEVKGQKVTQVDTNNVGVSSKTSLQLPFQYKPLKTKEKLEYIDYTIYQDGQKTYIYSIPKEYLIPYSCTIIVVSKRKVANHLGGYQTVLRNGHTLYWYILPLQDRYFLDTDMKVVSLSLDLISMNEVEDLILDCAEEADTLANQGYAVEVGYYPHNIVDGMYEELKHYVMQELDPTIEYEVNTKTLLELENSRVKQTDFETNGESLF